MIAITKRLEAAAREERNRSGSRGIARAVLTSAFWIFAIPTTLTILILIALLLTAR